MIEIKMLLMCLSVMGLFLSCNSHGGKKAGSKMKTEQESMSKKAETEQDFVLTNAVAEIELFLPVAIDSLGETPADSVSIPGTYLRVLYPDKYKENGFYVYHAGSAENVPEEWKRKKQKVQFQISEQVLLEQFQKNAQWLYPSDLKEIKWVDDSQ